LAHAEAVPRKRSLHWRDIVVSSIWHLFRSRSKISERIVGEPLEMIGARTLRLVVRVSGWHGARGDTSTGGTGVRLRVEPAGVIILEPDGREHRLPTPDHTRLILWGLVGAALIVRVASQVVVKVLR
jgi:hypothetical protein